MNGNGQPNAYPYGNASESSNHHNGRDQGRYGSSERYPSNPTSNSERGSSSNLNHQQQSESMNAHQRSYSYQPTSTLTTHYPSRHPVPQLPSAYPIQSASGSSSTDNTYTNPHSHHHLDSNPNSYHSIDQPQPQQLSNASYYPNPQDHSQFNPSHQRFNSHPSIMTSNNHQTGSSGKALIGQHQVDSQHQLGASPSSPTTALSNGKASPTTNAAGAGTENPKGKKRQKVDVAGTERKPRVNLSCLPCKKRKIKVSFLVGG